MVKKHHGGLDVMFHPKWLKIWLENIYSCGGQQHQSSNFKEEY